MQLPDVVQLCLRLDKSEKRLFSLLTGIYGGEKTYQSLYRIIQSAGNDTELVKKTFQLRHPKSSIAMASLHLCKMIMRTLRISNEESTQPSQIIMRLKAESEVLFEKGLTRAGFDTLRHAREIVKKHELYEWDSVLARLEIDQLVQHEYEELSESDLTKLFSQARERLLVLQTSMEHSRLFNLLVWRYFNLGMSRSIEETNRLNDLSMTELSIMNSPKYKSFEAQKLHLHFQAIYCLVTGNIKAALQLFSQLDQLFDANPHLWHNPPIYYFNFITGLIDTLRLAEQHDEANRYVEKLLPLARRFPNLPGKISETIGWYQLTQSIFTDQAESIAKALENAQNIIVSHPGLPMPKLRLALAIGSLSVGSEVDARKALLPLTAFKSETLKPSVQRSVSLVQLIIEFESENYERMESLMRSFNRKILRSRDRYVTERTVIQVINSFKFSYNEAFRKKLLMTIEKLAECKQQRYERPLFAYFDVHSWCIGYYNRKYSKKLP